MNQIEAQLMKEAAAALLVLSTERDGLLAKVAAYEQREEVSKVASAMLAKGLRNKEDYGELILELEKAAAQGELPVIARAVSIVGPDMGQKIAALHTPGTLNNLPGQAAANELVAAILR
jgi:hypothetical protein